MKMCAWRRKGGGVGLTRVGARVWVEVKSGKCGQ